MHPASKTCGRFFCLSSCAIASAKKLKHSCPKKENRSGSSGSTCCTSAIQAMMLNRTTLTCPSKPRPCLWHACQILSNTWDWREQHYHFQWMLFTKAFIPYLPHKGNQTFSAKCHSTVDGERKSGDHQFLGHHSLDLLEKHAWKKFQKYSPFNGGLGQKET